MKNLILLLSLVFTTLLIAQKKPVREIYCYSGKNNAELVKAKTDLFILNVVSSGIMIENNGTGNNHIDINLIMPFNKGKVTSRVRYDFLQSMYAVSLSNTKVEETSGRVTAINNEADPNHKKILDNLKNLIFTAYQKEINK